MPNAIEDLRLDQFLNNDSNVEFTDEDGNTHMVPWDELFTVFGNKFPLVVVIAQVNQMRHDRPGISNSHIVDHLMDEYFVDQPTIAIEFPSLEGVFTIDREFVEDYMNWF